MDVKYRPDRENTGRLATLPPSQMVDSILVAPRLL